MEKFSRLSSIELSEQITFAVNRIIYAAPGIHKEVSDSIIKCVDYLGIENIVTIVDADPEVCRLGYGSIKAIEDLHNLGITIRKAKGLRIGIIIVDNNAWVFSPVPLLIEDQFSMPCINALTVTVEQGIELIHAISPDLLNEEDSRSKIKRLNKKNMNKTPEIGNEVYIESDLINAKKDLQVCPPKEFNFERRIRVYNSHVQFVEFSSKGLQLNRHTLTIPTKLINVSNDRKAQERLKATYNLINQSSNLSSKQIELKISKVRKIYLRSLGSRLGNVILRQKKAEFLEEIEKIRFSILNLNIKGNLEKELKKSKEELIKILLPGVMKNPPDDLKGEILTKKPDKKTAMNYLEFELRKVIPNVDELVNNIVLHCDFKDITFEMLNDQDFQLHIRKQFPHVPWPKPFEESVAVQEK